jgi:CDP-glucose 4,6-dehydratase
VIGGGDYSADRLVPDAARAFLSGQTLLIRNPDAVRPWQHVLDPLAGYLALAEKLADAPQDYARGWNFGPAAADMASVRDVIDRFAAGWGIAGGWAAQPGDHPHEAAVLTLDSSAALRELGWFPRLTLYQALAWSADWYRAAAQGRNMLAKSQDQINQFLL